MFFNIQSLKKFRMIEFRPLDANRGESGFMGLRRFPTSKCDTSLDSVLRAEHFDTILNHFRPEPHHFLPTPDGSGRPLPPCDTSLDSGHRAEHFDTSLDNEAFAKTVVHYFTHMPECKRMIILQMYHRLVL